MIKRYTNLRLRYFTIVWRYVGLPDNMFSGCDRKSAQTDADRWTYRTSVALHDNNVETL